MDELPPKAAALLAAARRAHEPSAADSERVRTALHAALVAPGSAALEPTRGAGSGAGTSAAWLPTLGKVLVLAGLGAGALLWTSRPTPLPQTPAPRPIDARAPSAHADGVEMQPPPLTLPAPELGSPLEAADGVRGNKSPAAPAPAAAAAERSSTSHRDASNRARAQGAKLRAAHAGAIADARTRADDTAPVPVQSAPAPSAAVAPTSEPAASAAPATQLRPESSTAAPALSTSPRAAVAQRAGDELALIRAALGSLNAGHPREALQQLDQHAARYPTGVMAEERAGLRAIALCAAGDTRAGLAEQARFLRQAPSSALAARVRGACPRSRP
jgi:hypothetical protein